MIRVHQVLFRQKKSPQAHFQVFKRVFFSHIESSFPFIFWSKKSRFFISLLVFSSGYSKTSLGTNLNKTADGGNISGENIQMLFSSFSFSTIMRTYPFYFLQPFPPSPHEAERTYRGKSRSEHIKRAGKVSPLLPSWM